jgi:hypothetical protein
LREIHITLKQDASDRASDVVLEMLKRRKEERGKRKEESL